MSDGALPPVTIVMTTWFPPGDDGARRLDAVWETMASWRKHLRYEGPLHLHIADDGSDPGHLQTIAGLWLAADEPTLSRQVRKGVGASLNAGFGAAFVRSPVVLYAVDDWALTSDLDITPWVRLLLHDDIGMVRLGPPHPGIRGRVEMFEVGWLLRLERVCFAFAHRPALYHQRFIESYGPFDEGISALECERVYNERFCRRDGPGIVLALPHPWKHIDSIELADMEPGP